MNEDPKVQCRWCKQPAADPQNWPRLWNKALPLCMECTLNIKQVLKVGHHIARMAGQKLREQR